MTGTEPFRIIIVGGGIAGFSAAIALRGQNRDVVVLEQSRLNKEVGALISLQPNASKIIESQWNLEEVKAARGMIDKGFRIFSAEGELVKSIPLINKPEYGAHRVLYHRRDLHDALKEAATSSTRVGGPATIRSGERVVAVYPEDGRVRLESGEVVKGDLIVGSDGIHSIVRKHILEQDITVRPTGHSAYRLMIPTEVLEKHEKDFCDKINPREPLTSMMFAHACRLVMGPGRQGEVFAVTALVPDEKMHEDPQSKQSWVSRGELDKLLDSFAEFPDWVTSIFKHSPDLGLWSLRDLDPLMTWHRGRAIVIGDAAHAMLPTQGQGASQAIEDAEALEAFFDGVNEPPSKENLENMLEEIFQCRQGRTSLIRDYSRQQARPATKNKEDQEITMNPDEFMDYNCKYNGAREWRRSQKSRGTTLEQEMANTNNLTIKAERLVKT